MNFAPGTSDDCKKVVGQLPPTALLDAYRTAKHSAGTGDIVLVISDQDPDIRGGSRAEYARHLRHIFGARAAEFGVFTKSAHDVVSLPTEEEAMWVVVTLKGAEIPLMCVIHAMPYAEDAVAVG